LAATTTSFINIEQNDFGRFLFVPNQGRSYCDLTSKFAKQNRKNRASSIAENSGFKK
jgi:hypothetical protein